MSLHDDIPDLVGRLKLRSDTDSRDAVAEIERLRASERSAWNAAGA